MPKKPSPYGVWRELRIMRERSGWLSADLSRESKVSPPYLSQLENGERWPNAKVTKRLADALKCPVTMIERGEKPQESVA